MTDVQEIKPITMTYRNWRGEVAERTIIPMQVWYGSTDWHPEQCWLMSAIHTEKGVQRDFALADCQFADLRIPAPAVQDDADAMMADGLLDTVRRAAMSLYGETQTYPCDDVKRMAADAGRLAAVPDDVAQRIAELEADLRFMTENRNKWQDATTAARRDSEAQAAELARKDAALQRIADGSVDWSHKPADEMQDIARAALTQPTGD